LKRADLSLAQLTGAILREAELEDADLQFARLDRNTQLNEANLSGVYLDQIVLENPNLTVVAWENVAPLGDEKQANAATYDDFVRAGEAKTRGERIREYEAAVRANRILATALRAQGLADEADVFAYRAQLTQRGLRFQRRQFGRWLVSRGLALLSGYGYRLRNIFIAYGLVLAIFALIFRALGVHSFGAEPGWQALWDSFLVSLSAIHGRATFETLGAWTPAAWVAAVESVIGIFIEGVFVAMIIQRLFR
jgi:Pentapeptide repeats (8 copies)